MTHEEYIEYFEKTIRELCEKHGDVVLLKKDHQLGEVTFKIGTPPAIPLTNAEMQLIDKGQMINAIRSMRERLGCSLLEAKNRAEEYRNYRKIPF